MFLLFVGAFAGFSGRFNRKSMVPANSYDSLLAQDTELDFIQPASSRAVFLDGQGGGGIDLKPVLVEVGALLLLQAVGLPLLARLTVPLRRLKFFTNLRFWPLAQGRLRLAQRHSGKFWKACVVFYKNTGASKIVQRTKKLIHIFGHHGDHHHEDDQGKTHPTHAM